ncbi:crosslink repair DNA glycosylase YcaQ family protein [uncultured Paracoccus sp.]|uniref:winged helix-turn-helix domain-containing protein n=1 Tax=uncultured Paracoccus sp. TaxID=189685 RepID=UPI0025D23AA2|nr:crosslink repair DNA glycosylase YcaQ family protein [uncultured Paracoccus sp.]
MTLPLLTHADARRLFLDRHRLLGQGSGPGTGADLAGVLTDLGFVQVDSVNTLARSHDLILWSRRGRYRTAALERMVARDRTAFEHWTHDAAIVPMQFYPMWRLKFARDEARIRQRWPAWQGEGWDREIDTILQRIADHGPAGAMDVGDDAPRGSAGWWDWHPSKVALEYLWRSGRLAISHRSGFRKIYDLAERVIPAQVRDVRLDAAQVIDWAMSAAMDRLGVATSGELAAFFDIATRDEARQWCADAQATRRIIAVDVEMADGSRRRSFSTPALLDGLASLPQPSGRVRLLSPFDPALRDRARAERLFGFRYRIEIFVPAPQRRYGYYVFPVMQGDRLIGRLDARREAGVLAVRAFWPEAGVRMGRARQAALMSELQRVLPLAQAADIRLAPDWLRG